MPRQVACYGKDRWEKTVSFICDHCAPTGGKITCDGDYLKVELVKMKKLVTYELFFKTGKLFDYKKFFIARDNDTKVNVMTAVRNISGLTGGEIEIKAVESFEWVKV